ncbi:MAG: metallopeptidase family protein [Nitrospirota bacterium]|jgi:predicted Zn-dependent protease with MMP-like domain
MAYRVARERFEALVEEALRSLPEEFKRHFENIIVEVSDYPTREEARRAGVPREGLLGLFEGVPHPHRGGFFDLPPVLPARVVLYQKNIEAFSQSEEELVQEVRWTLMHEVGHYFGLTEEDLEKYE